MDIQARAAKFARYVGLELKGRIVSQGFTANDVADATAHSRAAFNRWLNGKVEVPMRVLCEVCEVIDWEPSAIVENAYARMAITLGERGGDTYEAEARLEALREAQAIRDLDANGLRLAAHHNEGKGREREAREDTP